MPSFDIVSKIDVQKFDNAINVAVKEISTRYDFNQSKTKVEFDKKEMMVHVLTENDMRMKAVEGIIIGRVIKQGIEASVLDFGKELIQTGRPNFFSMKVRHQQEGGAQAVEKIRLGR